MIIDFKAARFDAELVKMLQQLGIPKQRSYLHDKFQTLRLLVDHLGTFTDLAVDRPTEVDYYRVDSLIDDLAELLGEGLSKCARRLPVASR